ncbi:MAG: PKD domain-containing protein, partial [Phycisphaeraceae bacterium]
MVAWVCLISQPVGAESDSGITIPDDFSIIDKAYVWDGRFIDFQGTFLYDNTQPTSFEDLDVSPVTELTWYTASNFDPDSRTTHSGQTMQYSQQYSPGFGTEVFFTGGQIGQDWFGLRFFTQQELHFTERPVSLEYDRNRPGDSPIRWTSVEFQYTTENGQVQTTPVDDVFKVGLVRLNNDPPDLFAARINGINSDLVLDEKRGSHTLTLDALARDTEGGVLRFTLDGDGPVDAAATGPGSTRASHSITRTISGEDTGDTPHEFLFRVDDPTFGWMTVTRQVSVRNLDPIIDDFEVTYSGGEMIEPGQTLAFSASASDPGGDPLTFAWDLDEDGVFDDALGASGSMIFEDPDLTSITLLVNDGDGGSAIQRHTLRVVP